MRVNGSLYAKGGGGSRGYELTRKKEGCLTKMKGHEFSHDRWPSLISRSPFSPLLIFQLSTQYTHTRIKQIHEATFSPYVCMYVLYIHVLYVCTTQSSVSAQTSNLNTYIFSLFPLTKSYSCSCSCSVGRGKRRRGRRRRRRRRRKKLS